MGLASFAVAESNCALHHEAMNTPTDNGDNVLLRAIAQRRRISATYNRGRLRLEPHLLFFRHGEPYVLARNVEKPEAFDAGPKLGQFKLAGMSEIDLDAEEFTPVLGFVGDPPRAGDEVVLAVAAAA